MKDYSISDTVCIQVIASFGVDGKIVPQRLIWSDGREFKIEQVTDMIRLNLDGGTCIDCYTVFIAGQEKTLFFKRNGNESDRWFVQKKNGK